MRMECCHRCRMLAAELAIVDVSFIEPERDEMRVIYWDSVSEIDVFTI